MADDTARLVAIIEADIKGFSKSLDDLKRVVNQRFGEIETRSTQTDAILSKMGMGLAANFEKVLPIAAVEEFSRHILTMAAGLDNDSKAIGVTVEQLQTLRTMFEDSGGSAETADNLFRKLTVSLGAAKTGAGQARDAFAQLKFGPADISGDPVEVLQRVAQALLKLPDPTIRARIETELFGRSGQQLERVLADVADGLDKTSTKLDAQGKLLHADETKAAADAVRGLGDAWKELESPPLPRL